MTERTCSECGKPIKANSKTGVCRACYPKWYKTSHKEQERHNNAEWYESHKEERQAKAKETYDPERKKIWRKKYYEDNKDKEQERSNAWRDKDRAANPVKWKQQAADKTKRFKESGGWAAYYSKNKEHILKRNKEWRQNNKDKINKRMRDRMKEDPQFKLSVILRIRLNEALNNNQKSGSAVDDLGCSIEELKAYLESKFHPHPITGEQMTWDNWARNEAGWQIDHEKPFIDFDLTDPEQLKEVCHHTNLRPLWHVDHIEKSKTEKR